MMRLLFGLALACSLIAGALAFFFAPRPALAATLAVTSLEDAGPGTLREALALAAPGDTITFSPADFPAGAQRTIVLRSALPLIDRDGLTIDASNANVVLEGRDAGPGVNGLTITADNCAVRGLMIKSFGGSGILILAGASGNTIGGDRATGTGPYGQGNLISSNGAAGVEIQGAGADANVVRGNYLGVDQSGQLAQGNAFNGVTIWQGARANVIGPGNLISGNSHSGVWIGGVGTAQNRVIGNIIGANRDGDSVVGQGLEGVMISAGAANNEVGDGTPAGRNIIGGNSRNGIYIADAGTAGNLVRGNSIGANLAGNAALPNGLSGVEITLGAGPNRIGLPGQGNLLSGNSNHGLVITAGAHDNLVQANRIGPDASGAFSLGNQPFGGIDIADGADRNQIGGLTAGERNQISGNGIDGIALFDNTGQGTDGNKILGNLVGLAANGTSPLPNRGPGISVIAGAVTTLVEGNQVAYNQGHGIWVGDSARGRIAGNTVQGNEGDGVRIDTCAGNTVTRNSVFANTRRAIVSACPAGAPTVTGLTLGPDEQVTGVAQPNATIELYAGDDDEARVFQGETTANATGAFTFTRGGGFSGDNLTIISTDTNGNTTSLSAPTHLQWTFLLYFNGDNDLGASVAATLQAIAAGPASQRANVMALVDASGPADTVLYDLTYGQRAVTRAERNMGDGQTLIDFVAAGRARYPSRHIALAILDHGGGWAPSEELLLGDALPRRGTIWLAGGSGLSWDVSSDYDYLGSVEMRQALAAIAGAGGPLDVVYYDVCLMGMIEVAHQLQGYVDYFVSSQNIAWLPLGGEGRYTRLIQGLPSLASPRQVAGQLVQSYADSMPTSEHPFSIAALDLAALPALVTATDQLAVALTPRLTNAQEAATLREVYLQTQKIDYDTDLRVEAASDGFVDLYDFAARVQQRYNDPAIDQAAQRVRDRLGAVVVAERHRSGRPWMQPDSPEWFWNLENLHGLSIFLPIGEDLELRPPAEEQGAAALVYPRLRSVYTSELRFVAATRWKALIDAYYAATLVNPPVTWTGRPVNAQLPPDFTAPTTTITVTGRFAAGQTVTVAWSSLDQQSGIEQVRFQHRLYSRPWGPISTTTATSGTFTYTASGPCDDLAVHAVDGAGNVEIVGLRNSIIRCDLYLPLIIVP